MTELSILEPVASPQDLAALGALLAAEGYTSQAVRGLLTQIQSASTQVAMAMMPEILATIGNLHQTQLISMMSQIRMLPEKLGYVRRDEVLRIIQMVASSNPKA